VRRIVIYGVKPSLAGLLHERGVWDLRLLRRKVLAMIKDDAETVLESRSSSTTPDQCARPPGKPYTSPLLLEWGSIVELTGGPIAGTIDDGFSGSGGL
jgi:hypothetical protein